MRFVVSLIILMLVLTACGGNDGGNASINTQVPVGPATSDPENSLAATYAVTQEVNSEGVVVVTPQGQGGDFEVPLPGTLVLDNEYVDEGQSLVFDKLAFVRYSGPEGSEVLNFKLNRDGTYTLNDQPGQISTTIVTSVDDLLDEVGFFAIASPMLGPNIESGNYRYRLTVTRGGDELTINAEDGFTPNDVLRIFSTLMGIIVESQATLLPSPTPAVVPLATESSG